MNAVYRLSNRFVLLSVCLCLQSLFAIEFVTAQGIFSGRGIPDNSSSGGQSGWLSSGSSGQAAGGSAFRLPWSNEPKQNNVVEQDGGNTGWFGLPKPTWMQPRDPNAPTLMEQANERSKAFWGRTQEGFSHFSSKTGESFKTMNQNMRTATSESWARITGGTKPAETKTGEVRPPVGDSESWLNKNKDR